MDYFTDLLATFLDVDRVNYIAVYVRARELSESIKNILICVPKTWSFTGLERHGVNDNISILGWSNPLSYRKAVCNFSFLFRSHTCVMASMHASMMLTRRTGHTGVSACRLASGRWWACCFQPGGGLAQLLLLTMWRPISRPVRGKWTSVESLLRRSPPVGSAWGEGWGCLGESTGSSAPCPAAAAYSEDTSMHRQGPAK